MSYHSPAETSKGKCSQNVLTKRADGLISSLFAGRVFPLGRTGRADGSNCLAWRRSRDRKQVQAKRHTKRRTAERGYATAVELVSDDGGQCNDMMMGGGAMGPAGPARPAALGGGGNEPQVEDGRMGRWADEQMGKDARCKTSSTCAQDMYMK